MQLEANSGFNSVKTTCPEKIWFPQKLGKTWKIVEKPILFGSHHWIEVKITIYTKWVILSSNTTITLLYIDVPKWVIHEIVKPMKMGLNQAEDNWSTGLLIQAKG